MYKVVINTGINGLRLSVVAAQWLLDNGIEESYRFTLSYGIKNDWWCSSIEIPRHHPLLVKCVETLGKNAFDEWSKLEIRTINSKQYRIICDEDGERLEIPDNIEWVTIE